MALKKLGKPSHATVVAYLALFVAVTGAGGAAYAATGGTFVLGKANSANAATSITRTTTGPALSANVKAGSAPIAVNSTTKVSKLNADLLDGHDTGYFQKKLPTRLTFTALTPATGWSTDCYAGNAGAAIDAQGVVHLRGDMCAAAGSSTLMTTLPTQFRPSTYEYLTVDQCSATTGRIIIYPTGEVYVAGDPQSTPADSYECFVSLAGVTYTLPY